MACHYIFKCVNAIDKRFGYIICFVNYYACNDVVCVCNHRQCNIFAFSYSDCFCIFNSFAIVGNCAVASNVDSDVVCRYCLEYCSVGRIFQDGYLARIFGVVVVPCYKPVAVVSGSNKFYYCPSCVSTATCYRTVCFVRRCCGYGKSLCGENIDEISYVTCVFGHNNCARIFRIAIVP